MMLLRAQPKAQSLLTLRSFRFRTTNCILPPGHSSHEMQNFETHKSALENARELLKGRFANYQSVYLLSMGNVKGSVGEHWAYLAIK